MSAALTADEVRERWDGVRARIVASGGDLARVRIVAVTKGFGAEVIRTAIQAGLRDLGENYAQELLEKAPAVGSDEAAVTDSVRWHFLGPVQRNKIRRLAPWVSVWQGVDRLPVVDSLASTVPTAQIYIEVNLAGDANRPGCSWQEAGDLARAAAARGIEVAGLMGVAVAGSPLEARAGFRRLAATSRDLGLAGVSMGMSDDFELAVEEGSTLVRIGRALFGPRPDVKGVRR